MNNIFKDMMNTAKEKDNLRNKEVGKLTPDQKTKAVGVVSLVLAGAGVYLLYRMNKADTKYVRV